MPHGIEIYSLLLRREFPYSEFLWSVFPRIGIEYGVLLCFQSEFGNIQFRKFEIQTL